MKKILFYSILMFLVPFFVQGQYYYIPNLTPGENPGGLNTDGEFPLGGGLPSGWVAIVNAGSPITSWSSVQNIPFSFNFNGSPVSQYKVCNTGVLTFDVGAAVSPGIGNVALPTASIPDSSICVWGIAGTGSNDNVVSKTFGNAPNRQHWILFSSYTLGGVWSYWSIVLEESSDRIYVVDQRHQNSVSGVTIGVQINSTTATQVTGSPNVSSQAGNGSSPADNAYYEFVYGTQPGYDLINNDLTVAPFPNLSAGAIDITGHLTNFGSNTITSFDLSYSINGGSPVTQNISGVNIPTGSSYEWTHPTAWNPGAAGSYFLEAWTSNPNANPDQNPGNDTVFLNVTVSDPIPNILDVYLTNVPIFKTIATSSNQVNTPQDLDFHPDLNRSELWVINRGTENTGGSTVTISNADKPGQSAQWKQDGNAWHFMSLPSGIAFSENGNFGSSPAVFDANHDGGNPFTGPALWSSDPAIYAQPSGGNGSHLDMLHASPYCMGIAHEEGNAFWVVDTYNKKVAWYDFGEDHGPGNADHDDGKIRMVTSFSVNWISQNIPSHLDLNKEDGMLYIVDGGGARVIRMDINSGTIFGAPSWGPFETLAEYSNLNSVTFDVIVDSGLTQPSGILVKDDRMLVSDYANGDIYIYDVSGSQAIKMGTIPTGSQGIAGITLGPEGFVWYVNALTNQVVKIDQGAVGIEESLNEFGIIMYPNPSSGVVNLKWADEDLSGSIISVTDLQGKTLIDDVISYTNEFQIDLNHVANGMYLLSINKNGKLVFSERLAISK